MTSRAAARPSRRRIAILFHRNEDQPDQYVIHHMARFWREEGHDVQYLFGTRRYVPADVIIVHVDLSVVPTRYLEFASRYPRAVNGRLVDIRKSRISSHQVGPDSVSDGPVIAKSDLNYGGKPEARLGRTAAERASYTIQRLADRYRAWRRGGPAGLSDAEYQIFDSVEEVPQRLWGSPDVVVERFLPEREGELYHLRFVQLFGSRWRCTRVASPNPLIKAGSSVSAAEAEPHDEVFQWQRRYGIDYGKVDYVVHDGRPVLLDVNKTVGATPGYREDDALAASRRWLSEGIRDFLG